MLVVSRKVGEQIYVPPFDIVQQKGRERIGQTDRGWKFKSSGAAHS